MKKILSVILATILVLSAMPVALAAEADGKLKIAVASDLHFSSNSEELERTNDDEIFWYANRRAAMEEESSFIIDAFLKQCAEDDSVDYVLIAGDLADSGKSRTEDHRTVAAKLRAFEETTGKDVFVINGNHDASEAYGTSFAEFKEIYSEFGYDKALTSREEDCSYTANLGDKYRLIALDSNSPSKSTEDGMTADKLRWVKNQTEQAKKDGRYPIIMMHHNLLDHMPMQRIISRNFIVKFHNTTASLFADWGVKVVISGHEHCSDVASFTSAAGNVIYDFATTSLTMYPLSYRIFDFDDNEIRYSSEVIRSIDTEALLAAQPALSKTQTDAMNENLNAYAKGFLKAGVKYRLERSLSTEKIGIDEKSPFYELVKTATERLTELLNTPYEGENGVNALAAKYNISLPETEYVNGWDIATELVSAHYAGEESNTLDSDEVTLLLKTAALILKEVPAVTADATLLEAANSALGRTTGLASETAQLCSKLFGGVTAGEYFITALVSPFLYEFAYDADGVNDNNGTLVGYGAESANAKNLAAKLQGIFEKLFTYIKLFFSVLAKAVRA